MSDASAYEVELLRKRLGEIEHVNLLLREDVRKANNRMQTVVGEIATVRREIDRLRQELEMLLEPSILPDDGALPPNVVDGSIRDAIQFYQNHLARCRENLRACVRAALDPRTSV